MYSYELCEILLLLPETDRL